MKNFSFLLSSILMFLAAGLFAQEKISMVLTNTDGSQSVQVNLQKSGDHWAALGSYRQYNQGETKVRSSTEYKKTLSNEEVEEWLFLARELSGFKLVWGEPVEKTENRLRLSIAKDQENIVWDVKNVIRYNSDEQKDQIAKWMLLLLDMVGMEEQGLLLPEEEL